MELVPEQTQIFGFVKIVLYRFDVCHAKFLNLFEASYQFSVVSVEFTEVSCERKKLHKKIIIDVQTIKFCVGKIPLTKFLVSAIRASDNILYCESKVLIESEAKAGFE